MIRVGTQVQWPWGNGVACGKVISRHEKTVSRTIDGTVTKRKGTPEDPALEIKQADGQLVLKLKGEVTRADAS